MDELENRGDEYGRNRGWTVARATVMTVFGGGFGWFFVGPALSGENGEPGAEVVTSSTMSSRPTRPRQRRQRSLPNSPTRPCLPGRRRPARRRRQSHRRRPRRYRQRLRRSRRLQPQRRWWKRQRRQFHQRRLRRPHRHPLRPVASALTGITLPDGRPVPVSAIFEDEQINLTGVVPSQEAADRLVSFALGYRLTPATVVNNLTISPDEPLLGGVRLVEFNSIRFGEGCEVIQPDHAQQLDRIVFLMSAMRT